MNTPAESAAPSRGPEPVHEDAERLVARYERFVAACRDSPDTLVLRERDQLRGDLESVDGVGERDDLLTRIRAADLAQLVRAEGRFRADLRLAAVSSDSLGVDARDTRFASARHAREWLAHYAETYPGRRDDGIELAATVTDLDTGHVLISATSAPAALAGTLRERGAFDGTLLTGVREVDAKRLDWLLEDYEAHIDHLAEAGDSYTIADTDRLEALGRELAAMISAPHLTDSALPVWLRLANADARLTGTAWWTVHIDPDRLQPPPSIGGSGFPRADLRLAMDQYDELLLIQAQIPEPARTPIRAARTALSERITALLEHRPIWTGSDRVGAQWCLNDPGERPRRFGRTGLRLPTCAAITRRYRALTPDPGATPAPVADLHQLLYLYQIVAVLAAEAGPHERMWSGPMALDHNESLHAQIDEHPDLTPAQLHGLRSAVTALYYNPRAIVPDLLAAEVASDTVVVAEPPVRSQALWMISEDPLRHWLLVRAEHGVWVVRAFIEDQHDPYRWTRQALLAFPDPEQMARALAAGAPYTDLRTGQPATLPALDTSPAHLP